MVADPSQINAEDLGTVKTGYQWILQEPNQDIGKAK
jgi:hypothetical protein